MIGICPTMPDMDRRRFLLTSLVGAFATPPAAHAQQPAIRCIPPSLLQRADQVLE